MKETGIVQSVSGELCQVVVMRKSACGENCASCKGGCKLQNQICTAKNPLGAKSGDTVEIEIDSGKVLKSAFLVYMLPVIIFISAYFVCEKLTEPVKILVSIAVTLIFFLVLFFRDKRLKPEFLSEVTKILEK